MQTITAIEIKNGVSRETGKPWVRYDVTLDNGVRASGFDAVVIGEQVEVEQKGNYTNFVKSGGKSTHSYKPKFMGSEVVQDDPRHYVMRAANLLLLCHNAAKAVIGEKYTGEDARTLFIDAQRAGYVKQMPDKPVAQFPVEAQPEPPPEPENDELVY